MDSNMIDTFRGTIVLMNTNVTVSFSGSVTEPCPFFRPTFLDTYDSEDFPFLFFFPLGDGGANGAWSNYTAPRPESSSNVVVRDACGLCTSHNAFATAAFADCKDC